MMDTKLLEFRNFLESNGIDCVELEATIHAAEGVDLSRVLWALAHARHTRDLELYKKDMPDKCRQAIQHVADLCAIQAHTDVAPEAWGAARVLAVEASKAALYPIAAYAAASAYTMYSAAYSASAASAAYSTSASATAASPRSEHYKWERDTLTALISAAS